VPAALLVTEGPLFIANLKPRPVNVVINRFGFALLFWDLNLIRLAETFFKEFGMPLWGIKAMPPSMKADFYC